MCSFYALLHALFLCGLHTRSLIAHAQTIFITNKHGGWENGGISKVVRFRNLSRKVYTGKNVCRIVSKLFIAVLQKTEITDRVSCL